MSSDFHFEPGPVSAVSEPSHWQSPERPRLNLFERICAVIAFVLAIALLILGVPGTFAGCSANFTLPPILGVIPALAAWGIIRSVMKAW